MDERDDRDGTVDVEGSQGASPPSPLRFASDGSSAVEVIDLMEAEGFTAQMIPREGGLIRCTGCSMEHPAGEFGIIWLRRLEGASDPADMQAIAALECGHCGSKGTATMHYGPEASSEELDVLLALEDLRPSAEGSTTR